LVVAIAAFGSIVLVAPLLNWYPAGSIISKKAKDRLPLTSVVPASPPNTANPDPVTLTLSPMLVTPAQPELKKAEPAKPKEEEGFCEELWGDVKDFIVDWFGSVRFAKKKKEEVKNMDRKDMFSASRKNDKAEAIAKLAQGNLKAKQAEAKTIGHELHELGDEIEDIAGKAGDLVLESMDKFQTMPVFVVVQCLIVFIAWAYFSAKDGTEKGGLESIYPGWTDLALTEDCKDFRGQVYRAVSYQFSHVGFSHVFMNCTLLIVLGIPLEGYHGHLRMLFMFNVGVIGGALCFMVNDPHSRVVGMSGGCYSLLGMHLGDIAMNYAERRFQQVKLAMIFSLAAIDVGLTFLRDSDGTSHSAHFGGSIAGCIIAVLIGENVNVHKFERHLKNFLFFVGAGLVLFCLIWGLRWAPMDIHEQVRWCYHRQVSNAAIFGDTSWHCIRCDSLACVQKWSQEANIATVSRSECEKFGWKITER